MNCQDFMEHLNDALDDTLSAETQESFNAHAISCATCREEQRLMVEILNEVEQLPTGIMPDRDLWPGIAKRLQPPKPNIITFPNTRRRWAGLGLVAAAILLVVTLGNLPTILNGGISDPIIPVAESEHDQITAEYEEAKATLLAALELQRDELAPETLSIIEENLTIIENAVVDIDRAMAANPNNPKLEGMLYAAYQSEVSLLKNAVQLSKNN